MATGIDFSRKEAERESGDWGHLECTGPVYRGSCDSAPMLLALRVFHEKPENDILCGNIPIFMRVA